MDASVTITMRTLVTTLAVAAALLAAYFIGAAGSGAPPAAASAAGAAAPAAEDADAAQIAMTGSGEAAGVPDQLVFSVTVAESADDVSDALDEAGTTSRRVLSALADAGVERDDVQTTALSVRPQYDYVNGSSVLTGYGATQRLSVVVRTLADGGDTISAAVDAGGNGVRVGDLRLKIGDVDALLAQARDAAVAEAEEKAQQYADATGSELGTVLSVREVSKPPRIEAELAYRAESAADQASIPIRAGSEELTVKVDIVWSLT